MTVIVHRKSIEEAGTTTTKKGEEPVWKVPFELSYEGTNKFSLPLSFVIVGPAGATQAEEAAYEDFGCSGSGRGRPSGGDVSGRPPRSCPAWMELQLFTHHLSEPIGC
jgi:hypothetical protein